MVTQVDEWQPKRGRPVNDTQDVPGPQAAKPAGRVVIEIDGRKTVQNRVHIANADEAFAVVVTPFLYSKWIVNKSILVVARIFGSVRRPALGLSLVAMV